MAIQGIVLSSRSLRSISVVCVLNVAMATSEKPRTREAYCFAYYLVGEYAGLDVAMVTHITRLAVG